MAKEYRPVSEFSVVDPYESDEESVPHDRGLLHSGSRLVERRKRHALAGGIALLLGFGVLALIVKDCRRRWHDKAVEAEYYGVLNKTAVDVFPAIPPLQAEDEDYVAICLAIKGQRFDLPEFLRHHYYHLGIRNFYIFDDETIPPLADQLDDFEFGIPRSAVHFLWYDARTRSPPVWPPIAQQLYAYNECARLYGNRHTWLAFIDADEYLEMTDPSLTLQSFLRGREEAAAVGVNWIMHNSNGFDTRRPRGALRRDFTTCIIDPPGYDQEPIDNGHVKVIVQPKYYGSMLNPHASINRDGLKTVDADGVEMPAPGWLRVPPLRDKIMLHHYVVKSRQEYQEKVDRGNGMGDPKAWDFWDHVAEQPTQPCDSLAKYTP